MINFLLLMFYGCNHPYGLRNYGMGQLPNKLQVDFILCKPKVEAYVKHSACWGVFFEYINYTVIATVAVSRYNHIRKEHVVCNTKTEVTRDE